MQRRLCLKTLAAGFGLALAGQPGRALASGTFTTIPKSLWVWRTPLSESDEVMALVRKYNFRSVFYSIPPGERAQLFSGGKKQTAVIHACRESGIAFYAVSGDPAWSRRGGQIPRAVAELLEFQQRSHLFDGLCLDIEPHALPEWKTGAREQAIRGYLDVLGNIRQASRSIKLPLAAAVVPFFSGIAAPDETGKSVLESAAGHLDAAIMMAYRSSPGEGLRIAAKALGQLDAMKKPWWFGVTTNRGANEKISYARTSFEHFGAALIEIDARLESSSPFYRGIAINDYPSLTSILTTSRR
ncbi:MAG: hypothetical protein ABIJ01_07170 [Pseudomonadota bacterium]